MFRSIFSTQNSATGPAKVYWAGDTFFEPPGSKH
jgi:quercetin dioxygenase-like cupin family protein